MNAKDGLLLYATGLCAALLAALWVDAPGYMDADYYMATALRLVEGHGLSEPFLWNYLDDPSGLPHPSHLYWMPLTTFVAAAPMALLGTTFRAAQLPFLLLTAGLPAIAAWFAMKLGGERRHMWVAGGLAAASGFFFPFFVTTDSFAVYALIGSAFFALLLLDAPQVRPLLWLSIGAVVALAHLARADGPLLLLPALFAASGLRRGRMKAALFLLAGYLLIMAPWLLRNVGLTGSPLPAGGSRTLWLTSYDDLFRYPASELGAAELAASGLGPLMLARARALGSNLASLLLVNGLLFLAPLAAWAAWERRGRLVVQAAGLYLGALLLVMSLVFPFSGARGGFFHSSAAIMPLFWGLAAVGIDRAVAWAGRHRGWRQAEAKRVFSFGAVLIAAAATLFLLLVRLAQPELEGRGWGAGQGDYVQAELLIEGPPEMRVAVNNPPGFWLATRRQAVVIPNGGRAELRQVVLDYGVEWVVLEANHPRGLRELYEDPTSLPWARVVGSVQSHEGRPIWVLKVEGGQYGQ